MSITQRLTIVITLLALSLCALAAASIYAINGFQQRFEYVQANTITSIRDLAKTLNAANQLRVEMYRHQGAPDKQPETEQNIEALIKQLEELNVYYAHNDISSDLDKAMTEQDAKDIAAIKAAFPAFIAASRNGDDAVTLPLIFNESGVGGTIRTLITGLEKQTTHNIELGEGLREQNQAAYDRTFWGMLLFSAIVIIAVGLFAAKIIINVRNRLNGMQRVMAGASESLNLTYRADDSQRDEIGKTALAFNTLLDKVSDALSAVAASAQSVSSASTQITAGNEDLSSRTEEQAASLEQTTSGMASLNDTVKQNADNAMQASTLSGEANSLAEQSGVAVSAMVKTMEDIKNGSAKIADITGVIEGIAFQTNILALNAAVEAARAGEAGRGFAVVASEVRSLAQRSSTAAKEIKELIQSSVQLVGNGAIQANDAGQRMDNVQTAIRQVTDIISEIAAAATEQSQGIGQMNQAIGQMDEVTQQNAALVEEASAASQSLQDQATTLSSLVATFILNGNSVQSDPARTALKRPQLTAQLTKKAQESRSDDNWSSF
ncbi:MULTISPECIES: methyl-accepting chemotaxis protein [unclassified Brenneria]|uniref:methyl-accepting chemotaxis protein n=1 Tax=unclassified Brenneria TaxID=2634434 RepID=UPI0029C3483E|nr:MULTISPECIES: methyl-accepting chemotaxis protein [unclassified Brenneria]MDX5629638.1 methyl-accepting chemotaxis protein [Brenneria sp. L3-3Z]MDX5696784.1 methyl-accepting chemotaxis protein [Brenneria sp. L4-2C]